jgi:hypothetical protein
MAHVGHVHQDAQLVSTEFVLFVFQDTIPAHQELVLRIASFHAPLVSTIDLQLAFLALVGHIYQEMPVFRTSQLVTLATTALTVVKETTIF